MTKQLYLFEDRFIELGKLERPKDIYFKTQAGPVAKNATPRPPAGN